MSDLNIMDGYNKAHIIGSFIRGVSERLPHLNTDDLDKLYNICEDRFFDKEVVLNNTYICETKVMKSSELIQDIDKEELIMVENGMMFKRARHVDELPPTVQCEMYLSADRTKKKDLMKYYSDYTQGNDEIKAGFYSIEEKHDKGIMNIFYGGMQVRTGPYFNIDIAESITCRGRGMVCVSALTVEGILGGLVPNSLNGILYYINKCTSTPTKFDSKLDNNGNIMDIISWFRGRVDDYLLPIIEKVLRKKNRLELQRLEIKNNIEVFLNLGIVKERICAFFDFLRLIKKPFINPYINRKKSEELAKMGELVDNIKELVPLLNGFDWYQDTVTMDGKTVLNTQDTMRDLDRKFIALIDTDSNMIALGKINELIYSIYSEHLDFLDKDGLEFTLTNTATVIVDKAIADSLYDYTTRLNIPEEHKLRVSMKNEYYYTVFGLTSRKKNYFALTSIKEGVVFPKPKLDVKGLMFIKSVVNPNTAKKIEYIYDKLILRSEVVDIRAVLKALEESSNELEDLLKTVNGSEYYIGEKINEPMLNVLASQAKTKSVELYNALNIGEKIVVPSKFYSVRINWDNNLDEELYSRFQAFKKVYEIHTNLRKYVEFNVEKFIKRYSKKSVKIAELALSLRDMHYLAFDNMMQDNHDLHLFVPAYKACREVYYGYQLTRDEIFDVIMKQFNNSLEDVHVYLDKLIVYLSDRMKADNKVVVIDIKKNNLTYKKFTDADFSKCSIPESTIENPPKFILDTIDIHKEISDIDNLAAPGVANLNLAIVRSDAGKNIISNILNIY